MSKKNNNNNLEEDDFDKFPEISEGYKKPVSEKIGTAIMNRTRRAGEVVENLFDQESNTNKQDKYQNSKTSPSLFNNIVSSVTMWFKKVKDFLLDGSKKSTKNEENISRNSNKNTSLVGEDDLVQNNNFQTTIKSEAEISNPEKMTNEQIKERDRDLYSIKPYPISVKRAELIQKDEKETQQSQEILTASKYSHESMNAVQQSTTSKKDVVKDPFNELTNNEKNELFDSIDNKSKKTKSSLSSLVSKVSPHDDKNTKNPGTTKNTNNKKNSKSLQ